MLSVRHFIVAASIAPLSAVIAYGEAQQPHLVELPASGSALEPSKPDGAHWAVMPSKEQFQAVAPRDAMSTGMTIIKCRLQNDGLLEDCAPDPKLRGNEANDAAALSLTGYFRVARPFSVGSEITFTVAFQPPSRFYDPCLPPLCIPVLKPPPIAPR